MGCDIEVGMVQVSDSDEYVIVMFCIILPSEVDGMVPEGGYERIRIQYAEDQ